MTADNKSEVLHIQKIPNQKEFDAREAAWKVYAWTSAFLHDTAVRMDARVRIIRDPLLCDENRAVMVKRTLGELIAIKTDADEQVPDQYRPVLNGIYQYFLNEVLWYSKVDEMVYPLQYEFIKRACKEDHETAEEPSEVEDSDDEETEPADEGSDTEEENPEVPADQTAEEHLKYSDYTCLYDDNVYCYAAPRAPDIRNVERVKKELCSVCRAGKCPMLDDVICPNGGYSAGRCGDCELRPRSPAEEYLRMKAERMKRMEAEWTRSSCGVTQE